MQLTPEDLYIDVGITLHIRRWPGHLSPFVMLHGLSSNCRTWDQVAQQLAGAGHQVITVDQRGHGLSDKPDQGYDFATVSTDLARLLEALALPHPIIIGQSWGGNVVLDFGARYPQLAAGLGFIDGGYIDFQANADNSWERVSVDRKPPKLLGMHRDDLAGRIQHMHPDWGESGVAATLANFEILPDGTVRPWLSLDRHMLILRALWEQRPANLYGAVAAPVLICVAIDPRSPEWTAAKQHLVASAEHGLSHSETHWFENTDHDIHVQRPNELGTLFLTTVKNGFWNGRPTT